MATARLIVCETSGHWASALGCLLQERGVVISLVASWEDCSAAIDRQAASFVAVEASQSNLATMLSAIGRLRRDSRVCGVIVLADRGLQNVEPLLLEAGALWVATRRDLPAAAKVIQRCLQDSSTTATTLREEVCQWMPWEAS